MGPGPRFELGRKAPQASMLPSYTTPATFWKSPPTGDAWFRYHFRSLKNINVSF